MSHTPGPWVIERTEERNHEGKIGVTRVVAPVGIVIVANDQYYSVAPDNPDDYTLIAAAPSLLRAVYIAHGTFARQLGKDGMAPDEWGDDEHEAFGALKAAIAKAEGK